MSTGESTTPDIDNMKVPELKKRLKSMGLSTNGNKAELVERLQEAYLGEKDGSLDGGLDDESLEEALLNDDPDQSALSETMIVNEELSFSSTEKASANAVTKPLKKRAVAPAPTAETAKPSKPIVLKRNNYPTIEALIEVNVKKDHPLIEPPKADNVTKIEKLTAAERLQLRAKRFNISDAKTNSAPTKTPVELQTTTAVKSTSVSRPPVLAPTSVKSEDLDVLRKRAQRFGENVSTVMKQLENQEKLLKRKMKFSGSTTQEVNANGKVLSLNEDERKKKRMERFGL